MEGVSPAAARGDTAIEMLGPHRRTQAAIAALDRITIPQDALDRIAQMAFPRSSLIISDEALSSETGKDTEFVVIMSDEPQGGIKFRRRGPTAEVRYQGQRGRQPYWPFPFAGPYPTWFR